MDDKLDLFQETARRATYKKWVFNSTEPCSADKMAEAGFVFTGSTREPDSVQCFFCEKSLDGWEAGDCPWSEHLKHAVSCEFAKMQKSQDLWTLTEWLNVYEKYKTNLIIKEYSEAKKKIQKQFDAFVTLIKSNEST